MSIGEITKQMNFTKEPIMTSDYEGKRKQLKVIQFDKEKNTLIEKTEPKETFADVGGLEDVKKKIQMNFILPL